MSDAKPRLPREMLPASLICTECARGFKSELAYRSHMRMKHAVEYENMPDAERRGMSVEQLRALEVQPLEKLKPWMSMAIAKHELYGFSWEEVAKDMGRSASTLAEAANSPAGRRFRDDLQEIMGDAKSVVKTLMQAAQLEMYADWIQSLSWARDARDYKAIHTMMKDIGLLPSIADAQRDAGPKTIIFNFGDAAALMPQKEPQSSYEIQRAPSGPIIPADFTLEES